MAWAALLAGAGYADTLVQWGERPTGAGTPGTNIVSANQNFIGSGTTYSGLTNNPAVGANYYPESTGRSPHFSAAVSSTAYGGGRLVEGASNGDRIAAYGQNVPAASTYRGMVMWASNYFLITDRAMTVTNVVLSIQQRSNANTTDQGVRVVVQQGSSFYASDAQVFGANYLTQTFAFASATWYEFTPFSSGAESIGSSVAAPSFNNVQAIGYYFTARNGGAAAGACGTLVACFAVEGYETPAAGSQLLSVTVNNPAWGSVSPTGGLYTTGQQVVLTATPSNYFAFTAWSGSLGGSTNPVTITMDDNKTITATFAALLAANNTPHWWLAQYGLPTSDAGALGDTDNDGLAAWQEYQAGSNPTLAPMVTSLIATNRTALQITVDSDLSEANAAALARYTLNSNLALHAAALSANRRTVTLLTSYLPTGHVYTLSISGLVATNGAAFPATNQLFQCAPDLGPQPVNLIDDSGFDEPRSTTAFSNTFWKAVAINAGSSNGVELAGRQAWEVARFAATYSIYGGGDADSAPDTIRLHLDTFRIGGAGDSGTLLAQIRGVNGAAPTADTSGTALGSYAPNSRFSETYTYSFATDNDGAWHDETQQVFSVGADYDWYIVRINAFPNNNVTDEPEFSVTAMGVDDAVFTIDGHTAPDTVAPHPVTELSADSTPSTVTLRWRQATEDDTEGVLVLRRAGAAPTTVPVAGTVYAAGQSLGDATVVSQAPGTNRTPYGYSSLVDSGITAGVTYHYAVFACDETPNYATASVVEVGPAITYWWDANGEAAGLGGSGNWDAATARWRGALSTDPLTLWPNNVPNTDEAIFDGTAGVVTNTAGTLNVNKLTFRANGFTVTNGSLAISGADPATLSTLGGVTGTIGSVLSGTNAVLVQGSGAVILSANSALAGGLVVSGGTLQVQGQLTGNAAVRGGVLAGSGTLLGGLTLSGGGISPGLSNGQLSVSSATLNSGHYRFELAQASGTAGVHWDQLMVGNGAGTLDLSGAASGSLTLNVVCAGATLPGFDTSQNYSWRIAHAGSVPGFAASEFVIQTNNFVPALNEGQLSVSSSGGDLYLNFTPATPVDLQVAVTAANNPADVGVAQTYTLVVSNAGPESIGLYHVTNTLGTEVAYHGSSDGGTLVGDRVVWSLSGLAAYASKTLTVTTTNPVTQRIVTNRAAVSGLRTDSAPANNVATVTVSVQCPGAPAPFLPVVGAQSVETGYALSFNVVASNADCSPPAYLLAAGLPSGSTFSSTTNGYQITGLFSWPFAGAPGTYPVRFYTANVTSQTNVFSLLVHVGSPGEPVNGQGVPLSQTNWHVVITNLSPVSSGNITVTWAAVDGITYDVYSTAGNFGDAGLNWSKVAGGIEAEGSQQTQTVSASGSQRYYQVVPEGMSPQNQGVWAVIKPTLAPGFTTFSAPVDGSDLRFNGAFGSNLASALSGHNVQGVGDEVFLLNADGTYSNLYLDGSGVWRAAIGGTPVATHQLEPGQGIVVLRRQGTAAQPEFRGPVGNQSVHTNTIRPGYNIIGLSEGRYLSLSSAFSTFVSGSPAGSYNQTQADSILILENDGAYTPLQRLPDGTWLDLSTFSTSTRKFTPGQAYWYHHVATGGTMKVRF
jgi:autotransporter-associated beta strand protein